MVYNKNTSTQLKSLSEQFNNVLTQYQTAYNDYITALNSSDKELLTIENRAFMGTSQMSTNNVTDINSCKSACSSNQLCSGGTFTANTKNCILNSGEGNIIHSMGSTAIITSVKYYARQLQQLNQQLIDLNQQIMDITGQSYYGYQQDKHQQQQYKKNIHHNSEILQEEREKIAKMSRDFQTLNAANNDGQIHVTMYYYNYIVLLFITILLIFLLIKYSGVNGEHSGGGHSKFMMESIFLFAIMTVFLGISHILKNINGYIVISILVIAYLIAKMKLTVK